MASNCNTAFSAYAPLACPAYNPWTNSFGANHFAGEQNTFFGGNPWTNTFAGQYPSNNFFAGQQYPWSNTFAGQQQFPSNFAGQFPWSNTFAGQQQFPSTYGAQFPSTFGEKSWARHALPTEYRDVPSRPMSIAEYWSLQNPIFVHPIDGSRLLHVTFDVKGFKPEEVKVEINSKERSINVECKHESKVDKEHEVKRTYTRKFVIPEYYAADLSKCEIKSHVTADGQLIVESVLPRLSVEELKNLKEKVPSTKSTPFVGGQHYSCGPVVSIPIKTIA